jgi:type I restriction enzyme S subunit
MSAIITKSKSTWLKLPLGELCEVNIGRTPARDRKDYWGPGHLWLSIADMNQGRNLETTKETITDLAVQECNCRLAPVGTVLLSFKLSIGKVGIAGVPLFTNEAIASLPIRDNSKLLTDYLYWALQSIDLTLGLDRAAKGLTLNKAKLLEVQIPLPPLEEQKRIAEVLDRAEELRYKRREAIAQLDTLPQSIFLEMFGNPVTNPKEWDWNTLGDICAEIYRYPTFYGFEYQETGTPVARIGNILLDGRLDPDISHYVFIDPAISRQFPRTILELQDIVMAVRGDGSTAKRIGFVTSDSLVSANISPNLLRFKAKAKVSHPLFLFHFMISDVGQSVLDSYVTRTAKKTITAEIIKKIKIPLPPFSLQHEFAQRVEAVEKLKAAHRASLSELDVLFASLQHRAFRGEL